MNSWTYINFPDYNNSQNWIHASNSLNDYRAFLEEHAGPETKTWVWNRGDRFAQGVHIKERTVATMFKLRFDL